MIRNAPRTMMKAYREPEVHVGATIEANVTCSVSWARFLFVGALGGAIAGALALKPMETGAIFGAALGGAGAFVAAITN